VELLNYHSVMGWSDIEPGHLLSSGRLPEMTDIVSFVQKPVFDVFEGDTIGGYITIFAVDKDGKEHEIQECARSFPSLYHFNPSGDGSTEEHVLTIWSDWKIEYHNGWHESERNEARQHDTPTPENTNRNTLTAEDLALEAPEAQEPQSQGFSRMQGRLQRPAGGSISGRFGQARPGGGTWKGLFISTPPTAVRSIAEGEVAYAAPLQGYGNTVIIDHGSGYLSIYTGLSQISAGAGSRVSASQTIGRSGSLPDGENGLYFEIRYRNQAMNPASWVN